MPFSHSSQISTIVRFGEDLQPRSILDVGTGMGQYGFLLRTNLENVELFDVAGTQATQRDRQRWRIVIDGIEGFKEYLTPVHAYAYNKVLIGDALETLAGIADQSYELVLAIDILEHFETADGRRLLRECARVSSRAALISTPKTFMEQQVEANPLENHRSLWSREDLLAEGYVKVLDNQDSWIAVRAA